MKKITLCFLLSFFIDGIFAGEKDSLQSLLNQVMENRGFYEKNKEQNIERLKHILTVKNLQFEQIYDVNMQLYEEYKKYQSDSAVFYILKNQAIASLTGREELKQETTIRLAWLYSAKGKYIESLNLLKSIDKSRLAQRLLADYYDTFDAFCSRYGQSNNTLDYYLKSGQYRDSLLLVLAPQSLQYRIAYAAKMLYSGGEAEPLLLSLLDATADKEERGLIAYFLGYMYQQRNDSERREKYYIISAIADIEHCIKDNASLQALTLTYYKEGNIDKAYQFMRSAIDDAVFSNVRCRTVEFSEYYSIITTAYQAKETKQKASLLVSLFVISLLFVCLVIGVFYIYNQMNRLSLIRKELYQTNLKLSELNNHLTSANVQLQDANRIKEEYIAHFFNLCSSYIDKFENSRKMLNKYASRKQFDELVNHLRSSIMAETELEELYKKFDAIFINLYPTFVEDFNMLQCKQEQITLKQGELLTTELRIFALIRLGITDSVKIASFLRYSLSTIYNYRVKARNNAIVPRDEFEEMVMKIGTDIKK